MSRDYYRNRSSLGSIKQLSVVTPSFFLSEWLYRKKITLTGQANAGTNYQVKLLVGESSGSAGVNFHVEGHSLSFPSAKNISGDLRFSNSLKNTLLDFWVESVTGTTPNRVATIWVEVSDDLSSNQDIYCYYNGLTTNVSDGDKTFIFFDDFDSASVNTEKWTVYSGGMSQANSEVYCTSTSNPSDSMNTYGKASLTTDANRGFAGRFNIRRTGSCDTVLRLRDGVDNSSDYFAFGNTSYNSHGVYSNGGGRYSLSQASHGNNANGDYIYEAKAVGTTLYITQSSGISTSRALNNTVNGRTFYFEVSGGDVNYPMNYMNFVAIRRFIATEPTYNTSASEEYIAH